MATRSAAGKADKLAPLEEDLKDYARCGTSTANAPNLTDVTQDAAGRWQG